MRNNSFISFFWGLLLLVGLVVAQSSSTSSTAAATSTAAASTASSSASSSSAAGTSPATTAAGTGTGGNGATGTSSASASTSTPPDVLLRVPNLSIQKIELDVDNLQAEVNLAAEVASLVSINAGVQLGIQKVNITIADVEAQLELIIRLGHLVDIVNRTLASLNLNPLLINILNTATDVIDNTVGEVIGLLGSVEQGNTKLNFIIDNLGNIVQEVAGDATNILSSIVGNYQQNMTFTGASVDLGNGLTQKTYKYNALGSLVNIVFNTLGQVVNAAVVGASAVGGGSSSSTTSATTAAATTSAPATTSTSTTT